MRMSVRFLNGEGMVIDGRIMDLAPRVGEGVLLEGEQFYVGSVNHIVEGNDQRLDITLLKMAEARRFLGGDVNAS